jgi:hypothetical protein
LASYEDTNKFGNVWTHLCGILSKERIQEMDRAGYPLEKSVLDMFSAFADRVEILPVDLSLKNAEGHQVPAEEVAEDDSSQMSHSIPTIQVSEVDTASADSGCSYKHFLIDRPTDASIEEQTKTELEHAVSCFIRKPQIGGTREIRNSGRFTLRRAGQVAQAIRFGWTH